MKAKRLRPATMRDVTDVRVALAHIRNARDLLKRAGAGRATKRVRATIPSVEGALRHVERRAFAAAEAVQP